MEYEEILDKIKEEIDFLRKLLEMLSKKTKSQKPTFIETFEKKVGYCPICGQRLVWYFQGGDIDD
jgi:transcription initiation factor IIE alpha subunit